jgi:hypothetical protein
MRKTILTVLGASFIAALATQATMASEHHHMRSADRATASERFLNSNAYFAPSNTEVQPSWSGYSGYSGYDGASGSGMAGHWRSVMYRRKGLRDCRGFFELSADKERKVSRLMGDDKDQALVTSGVWLIYGFLLTALSIRLVVIAFYFKLLRVDGWGFGYAQRMPGQRHWRLSLRNPLRACDSDRATQSTIDDPSVVGQNFDAPRRVGPFDDFNGPFADAVQRLAQFISGITTIGKYVAQQR